uniref:Uncharacterized protein n=1 Tax=Candidatus Kentrum sp. SD TaxID=2126332 RepID=A0A451BPI6_9GAMM|nr:MAG: hypothetical protein BECKSD772D_GA0070982_10914 [Candidatus Kentron sp. SD]
MPSFEVRFFTILRHMRHMIILVRNDRHIVVALTEGGFIHANMLWSKVTMVIYNLKIAVCYCR